VSRRLRSIIPAVAVLVLLSPASAQAASSVEVTGDVRLAAPSDSSGTRFTGGGEFYVRVRGNVDAPRRVLGSLRSPHEACPPMEDESSYPLTPPGSGSVQGAFDFEMTSSEIASGRWRACVYVVNDLSEPEATADRVIETFMAPRRVYSPSLTLYLHGSRTRGVRCGAGDWLAWPAPKVTYAWRVNGRIVRGARRSKLKVRPRSKVACRVTLRNARGTASAWSRSRRV
jgi:hypothetical protein